jgi:hypothetical protein
MSLNEKVDLMIEKLNLSKLDFLIFTGIILFTIMDLGIIVNWFLNPAAFQDDFSIAVQSLFLCLLVPLLGYAYGYLSDRIKFRILVIRIFLVYAILTILVAGFVYLQSLQTLLITELANYRSLLIVSKYVNFITFPVLSLIVIAIFYSLISRNLGHWLISQAPKKMEAERVNLDSLFRPLPGIGRAVIKIGVGIAIAQLILIDGLWAAGLRIMYHGILSVPLLVGWGTLTILTAIFVLNSKSVCGFMFHATARNVKLRKNPLN